MIIGRGIPCINAVSRLIFKVSHLAIGWQELTGGKFPLSFPASQQHMMQAGSWQQLLQVLPVKRPSGYKYHDTSSSPASEVQAADRSHQKSQKIEAVEVVQVSKHEGTQCCCCRGHRAHRLLCAGELCCSSLSSKNLSCTHFILSSSALKLMSGSTDSLTGGWVWGASVCWPSSSSSSSGSGWRGVGGLLEGESKVPAQVTGHRSQCRSAPCSCLLSSTQMPYSSRHKRSPAGCRLCCNCCPNQNGCGFCCTFWALRPLVFLNGTFTRNK